MSAMLTYQSAFLFAGGNSRKAHRNYDEMDFYNVMFLHQIVLVARGIPRHPNTLWIDAWIAKHLLRRLLGVQNIYSAGIWRILDVLPFPIHSQRLPLLLLLLRLFSVAIGGLCQCLRNVQKNARLSLVTKPAIQNLPSGAVVRWFVNNQTSHGHKHCDPTKPVPLLILDLFKLVHDGHVVVFHLWL